MEYKENSKEIVKRYLKIVNTPIKEIIDTYQRKNGYPPEEIIDTPIKEIIKENNQNNKNTNNINNNTKIINNFSGVKPLSSNSSAQNQMSSSNIFKGKRKFINESVLDEKDINKLNPPIPLTKGTKNKETKNDVICNNLKNRCRKFIKNEKVLEELDKWLDSLNHNKRLVSNEELDGNLNLLLTMGAGGQYDAVKNAIACGHRTLVYSIEKVKKNRNVLNLDNDVIIDPEEESRKIQERLDKTITQEDYDNVKKDENGNFIF